MNAVVPIALLLLLAGVPASAQEEPPTRLDPVVVTPSRMEQRASEAPAAVTVISRDEITRSASQTVDDLLRQIPGFSLFRRTSSVVGHPTTQGLSLRGIGPSGTSRALVLFDDVPINDPFGGWVYWNSVPLLGLEQIEVVRGGGSSVWGNYALGGVVHLVSRRPTERLAALEASYGSHDTKNVDLLLHEVSGPLRLSFEGNYFDTDGYKVVLRSRSGLIDVDADSEHATLNGRVELVVSPDLSLYLRGSYYRENRGNGTPLQENDTGAGAFAGGGRLRTVDGSTWSVNVFAQRQDFHSTFTTQALDRNSETLALDQRVPTTSAGGAVQWQRTFGNHLLLGGGDVRRVEGETKERVFTAGVFTRHRRAGGEQVVGGVFVQDVFTPTKEWELTAGVRADYWLTYHASRHDAPPAAGTPARQLFNDRDQLIASPRVAALYHATATTDLRASFYQGFRAPTLNELYRVFRVRNDVTVANENLKPERLTGGEASVQQQWQAVTARVTGFWNDVEDLIVNVTVPTNLPDCPTVPVRTTCRQRQNVDVGRIRGLEGELEVRPARGWRLLASYLFTDATIVSAPQPPGLEGKRLAQVPRHSGTIGVRWDNPAWVNVAANARFVGRQFEDDLNTLPLGTLVLFDVYLGRPITKWAEIFLAVENLTDETYATGRTSEGVVSIGAPRLTHGGVRITF